MGFLYIVENNNIENGIYKNYLKYSTHFYSDMELNQII